MLGREWQSGHALSCRTGPIVSQHAAVLGCASLVFPACLRHWSKNSIHRQNFPNYDIFVSLKILLILANSADPDEMQHDAAFHLGLHCFTKYPFRGVSNTKG